MAPELSRELTCDFLMVDDPLVVKDGVEAVAQLLSCGLMVVGWLGGLALLLTDCVGLALGFSGVLGVV